MDGRAQDVEGPQRRQARAGPRPGFARGPALGAAGPVRAGYLVVNLTDRHQIGHSRDGAARAETPEEGWDMGADWHRKLAWAGFVLGVVLVVLQGAMVIPQRMAEGGGPFRALVFYFSFFTILTNTGVALVYLAVASGRRRLRALAGPTARTMMAGSIFVVMVIYALLLAPITDFRGLMRVLDIGLHYVAPVLYLAWWLAGPHPVRLRWGRAAVMMAYPLGYCAWVLVRGVAIGRWPYPFVSVPDLGWARVLLNMAGLAVLFALVFLAAIAISRALHARSRYGLLLR